MSKTGDMWRCHKAARKNVKAANKYHGRAMLIKCGVCFTSHDNGAHLRVEGPDGHYLDYWPGTGKWVTRQGTGGRGIMSLLAYLGVEGAKR